VNISGHWYSELGSRLDLMTDPVGGVSGSCPLEVPPTLTPQNGRFAGPSLLLTLHPGRDGSR
jgi:hypothetical protein